MFSGYPLACQCYAPSIPFCVFFMFYFSTFSFSIHSSFIFHFPPLSTHLLSLLWYLLFSPFIVLLSLFFLIHPLFAPFLFMCCSHAFPSLSVFVSVSSWAGVQEKSPTLHTTEQMLLSICRLFCAFSASCSF